MAGGINLKVFGGVLAALVVGYGLWGMYTLDAQERGVVFRFGKAQDEIKLPGLHWNPPIIDRVEKVVTTRVNEKSHAAPMLTEDENIVEIGMTVQYVIRDPVSYLVEVNLPEASVDHAMESALRHVVGSSTMDNVITEGRAALGSEVQERLQSYLNLYQTGIQVLTVNIDRERAAGPGSGKPSTTCRKPRKTKRASSTKQMPTLKRSFPKPAAGATTDRRGECLPRPSAGKGRGRSRAPLRSC